MTRTVVVGAGAAGGALAARLSEDPGREVVLLEAGLTDALPPELLDASRIPAAMPGHPADWSYPARLTPGRPYTIARGRVLGGSSTINGGYFVRARPADFDRWAEVAGPAWSYANALPVLRALESDLDYGETPVHGASGPMPVRRPSQAGPAASAFRSAAVELGFPVVADLNAPGAPGVGAVPGNVVDGVRVNTGSAYIEPVRGRPNLRVRGGARAVRVLFSGTRAVGVETTAGIVHGEEVVLCSGAIGTPHLLLLSGVGPSADLERLGIPVVADLPVGAAFSDHPNVAVGWRARGPVADPDESMPFPVALHLDSSIGGAHPDGDLELLLTVAPLGRLLGADVPHGDDLQLLVGLQEPVSRGVIGLRSADPLDPPRIDYGYLQDESDRARLRTGIRTAVALLRTEAFAPVLGGITELDGRTLDDDTALDAWVAAQLGTAIHASGSAPMGPVLDGAGRVHGVEGLRVADTSMLPVAPVRGPAATAVLIGELVARLIRDGG